MRQDCLLKKWEPARVGQLPWVFLIRHTRPDHEIAEKFPEFFASLLHPDKMPRPRTKQPKKLRSAQAAKNGRSRHRVTELGAAHRLNITAVGQDYFQTRGLTEWVKRAFLLDKEKRVYFSLATRLLWLAG
jgi:hypothetical protein